jgi:hypothetical protein
MPGTVKFFNFYISFLKGLLGNIRMKSGRISSKYVLAGANEPKCGEGGGVAESHPMSTTAVHWSPNKLWRSSH